MAHCRSGHRDSVAGAVRHGAGAAGERVQCAGEGDVAGDDGDLFAHPESDLCFWGAAYRGSDSLGASAVVAADVRGPDPFANLSDAERGAGARGEVRGRVSGIQAEDVVLRQADAEGDDAYFDIAGEAGAGAGSAQAGAEAGSRALGREAAAA